MASIDSSIYGQIQPIQIESPVNALAKVEHLRGAQNQNRLFDMKVADRESERASNAAMNEAYRSATNPDGTIDRNKLFTSIAQGGHGAKLPGIQKTFTDSDKSAKEAELSNLKAAREKQGIIAQVAGSATDQASWARGKAQLQQMGVDVSQVPDQFDPRLAASLVQQSLTGVQQLDKAFKEKEFAYRQGNDAANRGVTMRGQNMTDSRGRDLAAATREAGGAGKAPSGYRFKQDGSLEAIPGGPVDAKAKSAGTNATEGERKAATLLQRLQGSEAQLDAALKENPNAAKPGLVANALRSVGAETAANSFATGPERQRIEAAQLDILDAALTLGTGAAYTKEQLEGYRKSYFPQVGDKPGTIKDKESRLNNVIKAAKIAAGRAAADVTAPESGDVFSQADAILGKGK